MAPKPDQPMDSNAPAWYDEWEDFSPNTLNQDVDQLSEAEAVMSPEEEWQDWQTVEFPNALSVDALARESTTPPAPLDWAARAIPTPAIAVPAQATDPRLTQQPSIEDLVSLIQELNQCNSALIDRVSQLEDALEQAQRQSGQERSLLSVGDLSELSPVEQLQHLLNQLDLSQQNQQRQQGVIETLNQHLQASQERVAQLERDCAALQDQYNEQFHRLMQRDHTCRDLQNRLQRQQRYTLQYKAALEKCLDGTVPSEATTDVISPLVAHTWQDVAPSHPLTPQPFLPKVQRIQPWAAQTPAVSGKLEALAHSPDVAGLVQPDAGQTDALPNPTNGLEAIAPWDEATVPTPITDFPTHIASPASSYAAADAAPPAPTLEDGIDPLVSSLSPEAIQAGISELQSILSQLWTTPPLAPSPSPDGEVALWQDLARLIDVSTEDVLKASTAKEFTEFEAIAAEMEPSDAALTTTASGPSTAPLPPVPPILVSQAGAQKGEQNTPSARERKLHLPVSPVVNSDPMASASPVPSTPGSAATLSAPPSPLLYPSRSLKKRESLAAVELPTFPR